MHRCRDFDCVPLLRIWGAIGYAHLLVLRQYRLRQFVPVTRGMKIFTVNPTTTPKYNWWWGKRVIDNISMPSQENTQPIEEHLQVIPSELEIIKQDFAKK
ncbi:hypothetical protein Goarm_003277, partial [Gossypium armourianum]|nr:hypothetical protein [Gossypium armourianum]